MSGIQGKPARRGLPLWLKALVATLGMQTVASFLDQSVAVVAPLFTRDAGIAPERIGNLTSLSALGVVLFLLFGGPFLARLGPVRTLQVGALIALCGLLAMTFAWWPLALSAAILMGMGYGPTPPAGSRILHSTAPARHRSLIFSIKQAGAPLGGMLAGLLLPPVAAYFGWRIAIAFSLVVGACAILAVGTMRDRLDEERDAARSISPRDLFRPRIVAQPFQMIAANPTLVSIVSLGFSFAIVQGSLFSFTVTYLSGSLQMTLASAGLAYASMQFSGVCARIILGFLADRSGKPALFLGCQAMFAAAAVLLVASLPVSPDLLVAAGACAAAGFFAASWNGIFLAEVANHAGSDKIADVTSASTIVVFCGYIIGPTTFSLLAGWTDGYLIPFALIAAQLVLMALVQILATHRRARTSNLCADSSDVKSSDIH
ncbi:MAG: MFS transporter [Aquamicrobium sp.]|nr:MFS transporter [Aquamicrobium sp.]